MFQSFYIVLNYLCLWLLFSSFLILLSSCSMSYCVLGFNRCSTETYQSIIKTYFTKVLRKSSVNFYFFTFVTIGVLLASAFTYILFSTGFSLKSSWACNLRRTIHLNFSSSLICLVSTGHSSSKYYLPTFIVQLFSVLLMCRDGTIFIFLGFARLDNEAFDDD